MPMVQRCGTQGCELLTMGELCIEHEARAKVRSRVRIEHLKTAAALIFAASVAGLIRSRT